MTESRALQVRGRIDDFRLAPLMRGVWRRTTLVGAGARIFTGQVLFRRNPGSGAGCSPAGFLASQPLGDPALQNGSPISLAAVFSGPRDIAVRDLGALYEYLTSHA